MLLGNHFIVTRGEQAITPLVRILAVFLQGSTLRVRGHLIVISLLSLPLACAITIAESHTSNKNVVRADHASKTTLDEILIDYFRKK